MADYNIDIDKINPWLTAVTSSTVPATPTTVRQREELLAKRRAELEASIAKETKLKEEIENDAVEHPSHYTEHPSGVECIEITRHFNFPIGNAIKYLWRAGLKGGGPDKQIEDLKKAVWYITDEIKTLESARDGQ